MTPEVAASFTAAGDPTYDALKRDGGKSTVIAWAGQFAAGQRRSAGRHSSADHAIHQGDHRCHR